MECLCREAYILRQKIKYNTSITNSKKFMIKTGYLSFSIICLGEVGINLIRVWILEFIINKWKKKLWRSSPQNDGYQKWLLTLQVGSVISKHIYIVVLRQWSTFKKWCPCYSRTIVCNMHMLYLIGTLIHRQHLLTNRAEGHYLLTTNLCYPSLPYNVNMYLFLI